MHVSYMEGRGVMTRLLQACERRQWQLTDIANDTAEQATGAGQSGVLLTLVEAEGS